MIIGVCGQAGSGKDTAADFLVKNHGFVKVAFADSMKRICADVFGFTQQQLWGSSEFRNMPDARYPRRADYWVYPHAPAGAVWIPLHGGRGYALIDAEDFELISAHNWTLNKKEEGKNTDYARASIDGQKVSMHSFLLSPPEGLVVDHINGNGLDNRRQNMRVCTKGENRQNSDKRKDGESVFKGVGRASGRPGWRAYINADGKQETIGYFDTEEEAAIAYDKVAREKFGKFARLNSERFLTPRYALQQLGSEWGRDCFKDTWVNYALRVAKQLLADPSMMYTAKEGIVDRVEVTSMGEWRRDDAPGPIKGVVISDVRFMNEVKAIQAAGGKVYRMLRGQGLEGAAGQHGSETEQASMPLSTFDGVIDNREWTLEQLEEHMRGLATTWPNQ